MMIILAGIVEPGMSPTLRDATDDADGRRCFVRLMKLSGYGRFSHERGAFVVRRDDGSLACVDWAPTFQFKRIHYKGRIPHRVVAIVHTHPYPSPLPSRADRAAAVRLRLRFIVVAPTALSVIEADGSVRTLAEGHGWWMR